MSNRSIRRYFVYDALETALRHNLDHPSVGAIYFSELNRAKSLAEDLAFYYGANWQEQITVSPAGCVYRDRLQNLSETDPVLLIAHAYIRYLGDLSGGQSLKKVIRSALALSGAQGTSFYEFDQIATPEAKRTFKEHYRQALDELSVDAATIDRIVAEANTAFLFNLDMVHELEADVKAAIGEVRFFMRREPPHKKTPRQRTKQIIGLLGWG